jgi:hypothetical protein
MRRPSRSGRIQSRTGCTWRTFPCERGAVQYGDGQVLVPESGLVLLSYGRWEYCALHASTWPSPGTGALLCPCCFGFRVSAGDHHDSVYEYSSAPCTAQHRRPPACITRPARVSLLSSQLILPHHSTHSHPLSLACQFETVSIAEQVALLSCRAFSGHPAASLPRRLSLGTVSDVYP